MTWPSLKPRYIGVAMIVGTPPKHSGLTLALMQGMNTVRGKGVPGPQIAMYYDTNTLRGIDLTSRDERHQFYRTIREFYSRVNPK